MSKGLVECVGSCRSPLWLQKVWSYCRALCKSSEALDVLLKDSLAGSFEFRGLGKISIMLQGPWLKASELSEALEGSKKGQGS